MTSFPDIAALPERIYEWLFPFGITGVHILTVNILAPMPAKYNFKSSWILYDTAVAVEHCLGPTMKRKSEGYIFVMDKESSKTNPSLFSVIWS